MDHSALRHQAEDTVGIVIYPVKAGSEIAVKDIVTEEISCLTVREDIPIFHKIALSGMVEGQDVVEYGQVIGRATADIPAGVACAITFFCCRWMRYRARYAAA